MRNSTHFRLSHFHLVEQMGVQSVVPGSEHHQNDLVSSVQLVVAVRFADVDDVELHVLGCRLTC